MCRYLFKQMIDGLEACHLHGVTHRDLNPESILLDQNFNIKITDFGWAAAIEGKRKDGLLQTYAGHEDYLAPEQYLQRKYEGAPLDIFKVGVILLIMYIGKPVFAKAH